MSGTSLDISARVGVTVGPDGRLQQGPAPGLYT